MRDIAQSIRAALAGRDASRGQLLIEVLIALALMGVIATVFVGALYTSLQSARLADERSIALTLAKSELEYVKQQEYSANDWSYTIDTADSSANPGEQPTWWATSQPPALSADDFAGYSVSVTAVSTGTEGIRLITATVYHLGEDVLALENYESDR